MTRSISSASLTTSWTPTVGRRWALAVVTIATAALVGSCANPSSSDEPPPSPATQATVDTAGSPDGESAPGARKSTAPSSTTITVPDVSGMNHQQAQDTMQAAGLYNLREVDGKGLGRLMIIDTNWKQTGQSPPAGAVVTPDTVITLTAVKYTDK